MADENMVPKHALLQTDSESLREAHALSTTGQSGTSNSTDGNISVLLPTGATSSAFEINQNKGTSSNVLEPFIAESNSIQEDQQPVSGILEGKKLVDDSPAASLIYPRHEDIVPILIDYQIYDPPAPPPSAPLPPPPSKIQCLCCCFIGKYDIHYTRKIMKSKISEYMLFVLVALLPVPVSALYFGIAYKDSCPMSRFTPVLLIIMGAVGVTFIVVRLITLSSRRNLCRLKDPPQVINISLTFMITCFMALEMVNFYSKSPVFGNSKDPLFCEMAFYEYLFYMNFVIPVIGIFALLLNIPMKLRNAIQPENFVAV